MSRGGGEARAVALHGVRARPRRPPVPSRASHRHRNLRLGSCAEGRRWRDREGLCCRVLPAPRAQHSERNE